MDSLKDYLSSILVFHYITFKHLTWKNVLCVSKVFFDIVDSRISPDKLCQVLEQRNVLAMPAGSKR